MLIKIGSTLGEFLIGTELDVDTGYSTTGLPEGMLPITTIIIMILGTFIIMSVILFPFGIIKGLVKNFK